MRTIQFRGISKETGKWIYGSLDLMYNGSAFISYWVSELVEPKNNYYEMTQRFNEVIPESVGQLTGLKDKNEKEIHEGDIVHAIVNVHGKESDLSFNAYIRFNENVGCYQVAYKNIEGKEVWNNIGFSYFLEVIGNIHQNPELL